MENFSVSRRDELQNCLVPYDESLHSFVLRHYLMFLPESKLSGIIGVRGGWRRKAFIPKEHHYVFHVYPDHDLLEIVGGSVLSVRHKDRLFDSPFNYLENLEDIFFHNGKPRKANGKSIKVSFCENCIRDSIARFGYGYFKTSWYYMSWCFKHDVGLKQLPLSGFSRSVKMIKDVMRGNFHVDSVEDDPEFSEDIRDYHITRGYWSNDKRIEGYEYFPIKAARCLLISFINWLSFNYDSVSSLLKSKNLEFDYFNCDDRELTAYFGDCDRSFRFIPIT